MAAPTSPVRSDRPFVLENVVPQIFNDLGLQRKNRGAQHTLFLNKPPVTNQFRLAEEKRLNGYFSYNLLHEQSNDLLVGVVFTTMQALTVRSNIRLFVGNRVRHEAFEPHYILEKLGLLVYTSPDSSTLVVPINVEHQFLVKVDQ